MSSQLEQRFVLQNSMYGPGAPVLVSSGQLLMDSHSGQLFAKLIFENLNDKPILSAKLHLTGLDPADRPLGEPLEHYYLDLNTPCGGHFGANQLIPIAHPATRGFTFSLEEVIFADKTIWDGGNTRWTPLPVRTPLEAALGDPELAKQYRLRFGESCRYSPMLLGGLHLCSCGATSLASRPCPHCGAQPMLLTEALLAQLREEAQLRLAQEAQLAEQQRLQQEEEAAARKEARQQKDAQRASAWKKRKKKLLHAALWTAVSLVLVVALYVTSVLWIVPEIRYQSALKAIEKEDYQEAHRLFTLLKDYRNTEDYLDCFYVATTYERSTRDYSDVEDAKDELYESWGEIEELKYNEHGDIVWVKTTQLILEDGKFVSDGEPEIDEEWTVYEYNSAGYPTKAVYTDGGYRIYSYNSSGKLTKEETFYEDGSSTGEVNIYSYNDSGKVLTETYSDPDGTYHYTYEYDGDGNETKCICRYTSNNDAEYNYTETITYQYDKKGNLLEAKSKTVYSNDSDSHSSSTATYTYNWRGQPLKGEYFSESSSEWSDYTLEQTVTYTYNWRGDMTSYENEYSRTRETDGEVTRYKSVTTYTISYNALGHMTAAEGSYKTTYEDADGNKETETEKFSAEITCRFNGSPEEVKVTMKGGEDSDSYKGEIRYDENQQIIYQKKTYKDGRVYEDEYEYEYFFFPSDDLTP